MVQVIAGIVDQVSELDAALETLTENLKVAAETCKKEGIGVLIEALNPDDIDEICKRLRALEKTWSNYISSGTEAA